MIDEIKALLEGAVDPCTKISIMDMGIVGGINVHEAEELIQVALVPTTPFCPFLGTLDDEIKVLIEKKYPTWTVDIFVDRSQVWEKEMMSAEAHKKLGIE